MCELLHTSSRGTGISGRCLIRLLLLCSSSIWTSFPRRRTGMATCRERRLTVMEISIHSLLEGATRATGSVAVVDVFRAFTTAAVALANGALSIVMVRTVEEAVALRDAGT